MTSVKGFKAAAVAAGIRKAGRLDVGVIFSETPAVAAGVFTTNAVKAAPVLLDMERIKSGNGRAIVVNSGCANACTGEVGMRDAVATAAKAAEVLGVSETEVYIASTGVIGQPLPMDRLSAGIEKAATALMADGLDSVANAIMTTDTFCKTATATCIIGGKEVAIYGMAKGAGMIHPNMATMLSFIVTDAAITAPMLDNALKESVRKTFNRVTVDGDTSTNDTVLLLASGAAGNPPIAGPGSDFDTFSASLHQICLDLARLIAKDGEGATKLVEVRVTGAVDEADAEKAAFAVAHSPLVKTALFAEDANWGRILCAVGYSGARVEQEKMKLFFDTAQMVEKGMGLGPEAEAAVSIIMKQKEFTITVELGLGNASASVWTCDFSFDYVKINAEYRT
ncbi:MAG: bifunctional glutamate N-acetyltransferase/amino-acid acetyltransferase ArgJ [Nitrospirota bacterium]|nr:bifunctional glutamate N-acetyltransferase/amino-acid acetyltransferase ArgJ [Nitrospirota bacterium]